MMKVFYAHITGAGESGRVLLKLVKTKSKISSFFTGIESEKPHMINLIFELGEDPEIFDESVMSEINENILKYIDEYEKDFSRTYEIKNNLRNYLKNSLNLLESLKNLDKDQRLAQLFRSDKGRTILEVLRENSYIKKELQQIVEEKLKKTISNFDITLEPFIQTSLIKQDWIKGDSDLTLFLISDFEILRTPPHRIIENARKNIPTPELANKYLEHVKSFYNSYRPSFEDIIVLTRYMVNPETYNYIKILGEKPYPLNKFPRGSGESVEKITEFINPLKDDKIVTIIKDNKNMDWVFLLSNPLTKTFYPEYIIDKIRKAYSQKKIKKKTAIKHLELLEQVYNP